MDNLPLIISVVALIISCHQWISGNAEKVNSRRTLLLQRILEAKSTTYLSWLELIHLLEAYSERMQPNQRQELTAMVPRLRQHNDDLVELHEKFSNYQDGMSLRDIEQELADVNTIAAEAYETSKLIENGKNSYMPR